MGQDPLELGPLPKEVMVGESHPEDGGRREVLARRRAGVPARGPLWPVKGQEVP